MREVNIEKWEPAHHSTYFAHVASSREADAVGLVLVQVSDGSMPCQGMDSDPDDGYDGHVFLWNTYPVGNVLVQYFCDNRYVGETLTDDEGRHSLRLPPGLYNYRFLS